MKKKSPKNQKSNFIKWNKKSIFFLFFICAFVQSQNLNTSKQQSIANDSIAKDKTQNLEQELTPDSLFIGNGKFKFYKKNAHASYYADKFHGKKMANGKRFDMNKMTAAHKKLPFGTKIKITNEANGKSVIVEVTDRGPFVKSREIDLSKAAFMSIIKQKKSGMMLVTMEILQK